MQIYKVKTPIHFDGKIRAAGDKIEMNPDNALTRAFLHFKQIEAIATPAVPETPVVATETKAQPVPVKETPTTIPFVVPNKNGAAPPRVPEAKATASQIVAEFKASVKGK